MPGMIDTHRHMWQTALRGYGADWTLDASTSSGSTSSGARSSARRTSHAGNLLSAIESLDAGVTTTVDWSHGLQTVDHADAAVDALEAVPGRFVLAYGNIQQGPWEWSASPDFRTFVDRRFGGGERHARLPDGVRRHRRPRVPGEGGVRGRARARRAGHHARRRVGRDQRRRHPAHARARLHDARDTSTSTPRRSTEDSYHRIAATGGSVSVSTESEQSAGQGYPPTWQLRKHDIPVSLSMDTSVWWSGDLFSRHARDARRRPLARAPRGARASRRRSPTTTCAPSRSSTGRPAAAARRSAWTRPIGSLEPGKKADVVLIKNDALAGHVPDPAPVRPRRLPGAARRRPHRDRQRPRRQARRPARRHRPRRARGARSRRPSSSRMRELGDERGSTGMHPEIPETRILDNPYQYTRVGRERPWKRMRQR